MGRICVSLHLRLKFRRLQQWKKGHGKFGAASSSCFLNNTMALHMKINAGAMLSLLRLLTQNLPWDFRQK
jgi:hypothetical protein